MTKENINNFTVRVTHANKTEMIVILYDIADTYIKDGVKELENGDFKGFRTEIGRVRNTLRELMNSLDTSVEIGQNLLKLYIFCSGELTKAFIDYDKNSLLHVDSILLRLRESYAKVSEQDKSQPVMQNTEKVYNGLTYNRNLVNESVTDSDVNRGILA